MYSPTAEAVVWWQVEVTGSHPFFEADAYSSTAEVDATDGEALLPIERAHAGQYEWMEWQGAAFTAKVRRDY